MGKEPISLLIFRYLLLGGILAFLGMMYWSSLVLEENVGDIRKEISQVKENQLLLHKESKKIRTQLEQISTHSLPAESGQKSLPRESDQPKISRKHIDPKLPNLLHEDPFYIDTLPKLLGEGFSGKGEFKESSLGKPDNLHPFTNWAQVSAWQGLCTASLAELHFGKYEAYAPGMALKIEERETDHPDFSAFWIHLRDDIYWAPLKQEYFPKDLILAPQFSQKHPVTAHDFKFYCDAMLNPHVQAPGAIAQRTYYQDIENVEVVDDLTLVIRWKKHETTSPSGEKLKKIKYMARDLTFSLRPLPFFVYGYFADGKKIIEDDNEPHTYLNNISWAQNFTDHWARNVIVSCGPWIFEGMTEREIRFRKNPDFFVPYTALAETTTVQFRDSSQSIWQDFKSGRIDSYNLQPDQLAELNDFLSSKRYKEQKSADDKINRLDFLARSFTYIGWNEIKPFFASKKVRQALTLAIDRQRIIQQNLNQLGIEITCPFYRYSTSYDPEIKPWPFDLQRARQLLEEEGWYDSNGDGIIDKMIDGKIIPFKFSLTYFVKNTVSKNICEYVSTSLKELGIDCRLNGVDIADLTATFEDKAFDAICLGWALGTPPEDPRQLWHSSMAKEKGSSNAIGFTNREVDEIIDTLDYEYDEAVRKKLYYRFDEIFHDEAPYTLLYSPKTAFLYHEYLQNVFIPADRQDLIPGANVAQPESRIFWLKNANVPH